MPPTAPKQASNAAPPLYRGRFAPSPTGPLHFGSLVAATASYLESHTHNGEWLLRIEDIDPPREVAGASEHIIDTLHAHGFQWDGDVIWQRRHLDRFQQVVQDLLDRELAYACTCTRAEVRRVGRAGPMGPIYPGTCSARHGDAIVDAPHAIRLRTRNTRIAFVDQLQGRIECDVSDQIGDLIIRRKDGLIGYSLAVVIDDHDQGITAVVRGADLLDFTPAQIHLQNSLNLPSPVYMHVPMAINDLGEKLSKQYGAPPIDNSNAANNLVRCLRFLRQTPPDDLGGATLAAIWSWAIENWRPEKLAAAREILVD